MVDNKKMESAVAQALAAMGVDIDDHTADTPRRVAEAWAERLEGYESDPADYLLKSFPAPDKPGLVVVRNVRIQSTCAHHLLPIVGTATIAYQPQPGSNVVGLSKITRLAEGYARRLQIQEQLTAQIVYALQDRLNPAWAACVVEADHGCMSLRGVRDVCSDTFTYVETDTPTDSQRAAFWAAHHNHG